MRVVILFAAVSLTLAGCGRKDQAATNQAVSEDLTAGNIVANDVTAIDAATADAANMAADVDYNATDNVDANDANSVATEGPAKPRKSPAPAEKSLDNGTDNSSGNAAE